MIAVLLLCLLVVTVGVPRVEAAPEASSQAQELAVDSGQGFPVEPFSSGPAGADASPPVPRGGSMYLDLNSSLPEVDPGIGEIEDDLRGDLIPRGRADDFGSQGGQTPIPNPEPGTLLLVGSGLAAMAVGALKRRRRG